MGSVGVGDGRGPHAVMTWVQAGLQTAGEICQIDPIATFFYYDTLSHESSRAFGAAAMKGFATGIPEPMTANDGTWALHP